MDDVGVEGEIVDDGVRSYAVFAGARYSLHLRIHRFRSGQRIWWSATSPGYVVQIWQGSFETSGHRLDAGSTLVIEHGATAELCAREDDAAIIVFNRALDYPEETRRAGGQVHILPVGRVLRTSRLSPDGSVGGAIFADSSCRSCELWLHEISFFQSNFEADLHRHDEDEIIVVTSGTIVLGARKFGPGTAISIAKNTVYGFKTADEPLTILNFRPAGPNYTSVKSGYSMDERSIFTSIGSPRYAAPIGSS